MTVDEWLKLGYDQGWCGPPVCASHDGIPSSEAEDQSYEEGDDVCVHILRLYPDTETKAAIEADHSPSVWRATNQWGAV